MVTDSLLTQRFEMKYLVREETALAIRRYLSCFMTPDEFAVTQPDYAYPVHSLYLDSSELATFHAVEASEKNRFKLRLRYYGANDATIYFEIKRRTNEVITKMRAGVRREAVQGLLDGRPPKLEHLAKPGPRQLVELQEFCRLMRRLSATPRSHVAYLREAWMSRSNNSLRVTFDRNVECEPEFSSALRTRRGLAVTPFQRQVILELKFVDRLPRWCLEMIQMFDLVRSGAPKYAYGVLMLGEHKLSNRGVGITLPAPQPVERPRGLPVRVPGLVGTPAVAVA